jgi:hypothetical protein
MKQCIKEQIEKLDYETQLRVNETIQALDNGKASSIEFYSDGSGVSFEYHHPTINHGCPGTLASSFRTEQALIILAGHRLCSHKLPKCF